MASRMASHAQEIDIVGNGNVFSIVLQKTNHNWFAYDWPYHKIGTRGGNILGIKHILAGVVLYYSV